MMSKKPNFPCRFSCTQGAVKSWESGDSWSQEGLWGHWPLCQQREQQFLVSKDKETDVAGLGHMVERNSPLLQGRSCPHKHTRYSQGGVPASPSPDSRGGLPEQGEGRAEM